MRVAVCGMPRRRRLAATCARGARASRLQLLGLCALLASESHAAAPSGSEPEFEPASGSASEPEFEGAGSASSGSCAPTPVATLRSLLEAPAGTPAALLDALVAPHNASGFRAALWERRPWHFERHLGAQGASANEGLLARRPDARVLEAFLSRCVSVRRDAPLPPAPSPLHAVEDVILSAAGAMPRLPGHPAVDPVRAVALLGAGISLVLNKMQSRLPTLGRLVAAVSSSPCCDCTGLAARLIRIPADRR